MKRNTLNFEALNFKFEVIAQKQLQCIKGGYASQEIQQPYAASYNGNNEGNYVLNDTLNFGFRENLLHVQYFPENVTLTPTYNENQNDLYKPNLIGFDFYSLDRQPQLIPFGNENYNDFFDQVKLMNMF